MTKELLIFLGHSADAQGEADAVHAMQQELQEQLDRDCLLGDQPVERVKIWVWHRDAQGRVGGQDATVSDALERCALAIFPFKERVGETTWLELERCRERALQTPHLPFVYALFPDKAPHGGDMDDLDVAERWVDLLKKKRSLVEDWNAEQSKSVLPLAGYQDVEELKARIREKFTADLPHLLKRLESGGEKSSPSEAPGAVDAEIAGYLTQAAAFHGSVSLAGFETRVRVPIELKDLYVPLNAMLDRGARSKSFGSAEEAEKLLGDEHERQDQIPLVEAFEKARELGGRRGVLILGDPGSGKTTHLKRLLVWLVNEGPESIGLPAGTVPVFLPLRDLTDLGAGLDAFLEAELDRPHLKMRAGFGGRLLERGRILFLLDGLDEIANVERREEVARWIEEAARVHETCHFVVTCRYAGYTGDVQFEGGFLELHLRPLNAEQARSFVRNWFRIVERSLNEDKDEAEREAAAQADELLERLAEPNFRARRVFELTRNPLLLTAICLVHRDRGELPHRRADLYDECVNVLLERWRRAKKLTVAYDAKRTRMVLQPIAHWLHGEDGRVRATHDEMEEVVAPHVEKLGAEEETADGFLRRIRDESGLLTGWSERDYGFLHLGFQEYLTARDIHDLSFEDPAALDALADRFGESWWQEVILLLLAGTDPPLFESFLRRVVQRPAFAEHRDLVEQCLDDASRVSATPFLELLAQPPGSDEELWNRQLLALQLVERIDSEQLESLREELRNHPFELIQARSAEAPAEVDSRRADRGGYELVRIPAGEFKMRSRGLQHRVVVPEFWLGRFPVTNEEYARFLEESRDAPVPQYWDDRRYNQPRLPVVGVSWEDARAYCRWAGLVLPSEAQWEYACRAGTTSRFWSGDTEEDLERVGWFRGNSNERPHPVGEKPANAFGLHDVHGNVWEWCQDTTRSDALESRSSRHRVVRGGAFISSAERARSVYRLTYGPQTRNNYTGFRAARASQPSDVTS